MGMNKTTIYLPAVCALLVAVTFLMVGACPAAEDGRPPNIVYVLWDDTAFGAVGFPALQKNFGYETPQINRMAAEGIIFTRMYTEPSCTPTRAAVLTGRHPVRHGMGVVGMPHEFSGLRGEEVTVAEVLSAAGYATAFCGKGLSTIFGSSPLPETQAAHWERHCSYGINCWTTSARPMDSINRRALC